jgi:hypothetical protein
MLKMKSEQNNNLPKRRHVLIFNNVYNCRILAEFMLCIKYFFIMFEKL